MIEKLSLEKFYQIKQSIMAIYRQAEETISNNTDENFNEDEYTNKIIDELYKLQSELLSYDLSDIPFMAWDGYIIICDDDHVADFSKTKANIDFNILDYYGNAIFKSCNIRNLKKIDYKLNPDIFDERTIKENQELFLSDIFSSEFKKKFYAKKLIIDDLAQLTNSQLDELKQKNYLNNIESFSDTDLMIGIFGVEKAILIYKKSSEEFAAVAKIIYNAKNFYRYSNSHLQTYEQLLEQLKTCPIGDIKSICFKLLKDYIEHSNEYVDIDQIPELFIKENAHLFLIDVDLPDDVKERYLARNLSIEDVIDHLDAFKDISIDYRMDSFVSLEEFIRENYGLGKFKELLFKYSDVFRHISSVDSLYSFEKCFPKIKNIDTAFIRALKDYFVSYDKSFNECKDYDEHGNIIYKIPEWLKSMNFTFVETLGSLDDLLNYNDNIFILDDYQRGVIDDFGIENIIRFEKETGFFSHKGHDYSKNLEMFEAISSYFKINPSSLDIAHVDYKEGELSYDDFLVQFAKMLDVMRKNNLFTDYPDYDFITGSFREKFPHIFIEENAPEELKYAFYRNRVTPGLLYNNKEYIPYLIPKDLVYSINARILLVLPGLVDQSNKNMIPTTVDFIKTYVSMYGNEKLLNLLAKYGPLISFITIDATHGEIDDEQKLEKSIRSAIYKKILSENVDYSYLKDVPDFKNTYSDIFVDFSKLPNLSAEEVTRLTNAFYNRNLSFVDIYLHPELVEVLKDKNLFLAFGNKNGKRSNGRIIKESFFDEYHYSDLEFLQVFGNEKFLQMCSKYGRYMENMASLASKDLDIAKNKYINLKCTPIRFLEFEDICRLIEEIIVKRCQDGNLSYYPEDAPEFLKKQHPELFLNDDAPALLKQYFYNANNNYPMNFDILREHKEWLPHLKGKNLLASLLRDNHYKSDMVKFFEVFGDETAIKLGISRTETVKEMLRSHQVDLMKKWFDKTGRKFIPDFVVMQNIPFEDADKFLTNASNWSALMRITSFASNPDARDAMLKIAYSFGSFDQDKSGFKKAMDLLTSLPRRLGHDYAFIIPQIDNDINSYVEGSGIIENGILVNENELRDKLYNFIKSKPLNEMFDIDLLVSLFESIKSENLSIDFTKPILSQLYRANEDGTRTLIINQQNYPQTTKAIRAIVEKYRAFPIISPDAAHHYLGGFKLEYDPDFREFFLNNFELIISEPKYMSSIATIQRRFKEIKAVYSNVNLTLDLALSYLDSNKYENVNPGNERVAQVAAIQNYSQQEFELIQKIFNYGKQRTYSSIPRIESKKPIELPTGKYYYEILRLDDPRAMSIGYESDCCQRLGEPAEVCMEHSMVNQHGRVFIITNERNEVVAQSWVWRNKDVLCFDNIEVPDQKMWDNGIPRGKEDSGIRNIFTDDILTIYKMAAHELMERDNEVYKELFERGQITEEQYEGLRLGKITAGLGFSNISGSLRTLSVDKDFLARPLPFEPPVHLKRSLYTSDSTTQFILEQRDDRIQYEGDTLAIHNDVFSEYTDNNFTEKDLLSLNKLEIVTKGDSYNLDTVVSDYEDSGHIVSEIAYNYSINPENIRIVMNSNFAIIFEIVNNCVKVYDLFYNLHVDNGEQQMDIQKSVILQIRLAFDQIANGKEIDTSLLNENQLEVYNLAIGLTTEIDDERGINHAK